MLKLSYSFSQGLARLTYDDLRNVPLVLFEVMVPGKKSLCSLARMHFAGYLEGSLRRLNTTINVGHIRRGTGSEGNAAVWVCTPKVLISRL